MIETKDAPTTLPPPPPCDATPQPMDDVDHRGITLTFDFTRAIVENPDILDDIPNGALVVLIPPDDPELATREIEAGIAWLRQGADVYFRHVRPGDRVPAGGE